MTTYSISLDDVDIALLPVRNYQYNDFLKKEHFEFQVMRTDIVEEPEPVILYTCHTCAIKVPAAFASEHATSAKHRANARIASAAAKRTRALITARPPPAAQSTARFCANCAATVGRNHEETKEHRVAVLHDKLLWELMMAYVGGDDDDDESNYDSESDESIEEENGSKCNGFGTWDKVNGKEEKEKNCDKTVALKIETAKEINKIELNEEKNKDNTNVDNMPKICKKTDKIEASSEDKADIRTNGKDKETDIRTDRETESNTNGEAESNINKEAESNTNIEAESKTKRETESNTNREAESNTNREAESNTNREAESNTNREAESKTKRETESYTNNEDIASKPKTQDIKIDYVEFVTKGNKLVKVFSDYYHSFCRKVDTINCKVCNITFKNNEVDAHMFSLKHLNKMPSTMIDERCVRQIDEVYSHCILCNQMVKNSNVTKHYLTIGHGQRETQAVTDNNYLSNTSKTHNASSRPADVTTNAAKVKTPEKPKHANVAKPIDWPVIYPYEVTNEDKVRCVICDCNVPNNPENRKSHLDGSNHAKNVKNKRVSLLSALL